MTRLTINGGRPLSGRVTPSANKNAVLPVLCASLLTREPVILSGVPDVTDARKLLDLFKAIGTVVEADLTSGSVRMRHGGALNPEGARLPAGMRSSLMLIPPLLHRFGRVMVEEETKGCTLGVREIDPHIEVFKGFGAHVEETPEGLVITAPRALAPMRHWLDYASVTTTENFLLCAVKAGGRSRLVNAACEPHVQELCRFLSLMGARIEGAGASTLQVEGQAELGGATYAFAEDHHEIATFLALGAMTGGQVEVRNGAPDQFQLLDRTFAKFGADIVHLGGWSRVRPAGALKVRPPFTAHLTQKVEAAPWPYVPADLLPIFIALGVRAEGSMLFWNKVYEGALGWTAELAKFGAQVVACDPHRVITVGDRPLAPAEVESPYIIRVAIALLMVAASIPGRSVIHNADPIRRAHPHFVENLRGLGADVAWEDPA
ncbi:MAG: UDP-N-acetylglucosamine 1-carboxyvinyltransferase [Caulobacteraceae bacterium]|nr:UDP-N-acetylglucosamine 1-carboxyvinyltransferase [Caulobacteraceae bacterium]